MKPERIYITRIFALVAFTASFIIGNFSNTGVAILTLCMLFAGYLLAKLEQWW